MGEDLGGANMLKQSLQQKLLQKLSPQQIQLMKLLQIPTVALEQRIKEELQDNPALEEGKDEEEEAPESEEDEVVAENDDEENPDDDPREDFDIDEYLQDDEIASYKTSVSNVSPDDERRETPIVLSASFQDMLSSQLGMCNFDDHQHQIAEHILGNIDDDGYLRRPLNAIVNDIAFSQNITTDENELLAILETIQTFDPAGVGARDLQECLSLQLKRKNQHEPSITLATKIISEYMDEFSKKHYEKIMAQLQVSEEKLKEAMHEILKLNPKPGNTFSDTQKSQQHIVPDFIITNNDGVLELSLNSRNAPELKVSKSYMEMLEAYSKDKQHKKQNKDAVLFVKQKLDSAKWFIDAINQRQQTLLTTMTAIMNYQYEYFLDGDETKLKPMILKDIAEKVGLDISTVSRVSNSKYVQTPFGTLLLKSFFSESMSTDSGEEVSSREVKKILSDCIAAEDKRRPWTDEKLMKILNEKGYNIARRTVAKYREMLEIPVARMRKEL